MANWYPLVALTFRQLNAPMHCPDILHAYRCTWQARQASLVLTAFNIEWSIYIYIHSTSRQSRSLLRSFLYSRIAQALTPFKPANALSSWICNVQAQTSLLQNAMYVFFSQLQLSGAIVAIVCSSSSDKPVGRGRPTQQPHVMLYLSFRQRCLRC